MPRKLDDHLLDLVVVPSIGDTIAGSNRRVRAKRSLGDNDFGFLAFYWV